MMAKTLPSTLIFVLALALNGANAQTIADERLKIDQYGQQLSSLQKANSDIESQVAELSQQISKLAGKSAPEKKVRDAAEARYQAAVKAAEDKPSIPNKERAESARFEFVMADRKYQRASQDATKLKNRQQALQAQLDGNRKKINTANRGIAQQQQLILAMEQEARQQASQQAINERQLRLKREGALRSSQSELDRAREEHTAAMAEIVALKAMLAEKEAAALAAAAKPSVAVASAAPQIPPAVAADSSANQPAAERIGSVKGSRDQYYQLLATAEQGQSKHRVNKILHIKTYSNDRLRKQTSHSLKYLGNGIYEGKTVVRAGSTRFIVGSKQWNKTIPDGDHKQRYIFMLDTRDKSTPELLLFARSDIE